MSLNGMPRPLKFNSLNEFVLANSQNFEQTNTSKFPNTDVFVSRKNQPLYDRYNVNNLLLQKVNKNHLQVLTKNVILNEQDITPNNVLSRTGFKVSNKPLNQTTKQPAYNNFMQTNQTGVNNYQSQKLQNSPKKIIAHTSQGFYVPAQKTSKQFSQNELLFNFNKIAEQKKAKKKQFLQTIQAKLNLIQLEAKELEECQFEEKNQLQQIQKIQGEMGRQLISNVFVGKVTQKIYQNTTNQEESDQQQHVKPKSLHVNMSPVEINHVLNSHYQQNEKLLDEILRVKSKSKQKSTNLNAESQKSWTRSPNKTQQVNKTGGIGNNFSKTAINQPKLSGSLSQTQKKVISTTTKLPPKQGKK